MIDAIYVRAISVIRSCKSARQLPPAKKYCSLAVKKFNLPKGMEEQLANEFTNQESDLYHPDQIYFKGKYIFIERVIRNKITPKEIVLNNRFRRQYNEWMDF